jgi:UDP-N-acetylmuramate: L-alanyl-gamma-D-glutamyl-meso-diaminopimelate ligase
VELLPADGFLAACSTWDSVVAISRAARCPVETYSVERPADWEARGLALGADGARFRLVRGGRDLGPVRLAVGGAHNVENALGVAAAATRLGLSFEEIAAGLEAFRGVKRRQEVRGVVDGVTVVDDFAHHPTAVDRTLAAIQGSYPGARLLVAFEPRSNTSRRNLHQEEYARSFGAAAEVWLLRPAPTDRVPEAERLDVDRLAAEIAARGVPAVARGTVDEIVADVAARARPGDVVVAMSNGAFGGVWTKVLEALRAR